MAGGTYGETADYHFGGTSGTDGVLYIHPQDADTEITISTEGATTDRIEVTSAATVLLAGVNVDRSNVVPTTSSEEGAGLTVPYGAAFNVNLLLADDTQNILKGSQGADGICLASPGIRKGNGDGTLTIGVKEDSNGTGQLEAVAGDNNAAHSAAGIGERAGNDATNITITGGIISAKGSGDAPGIGSAGAGDADNIKITGGKVYAYGGRIEGNAGGLGIGAGGMGGVRNITISGGEVEAYGYFAPGIGGRWVDGINITGGKVTAIAEDSSGGSAGIGTSGGGDAKNINITGGVIIATGGDSGPGIGSAFTKTPFPQDITLDGNAVVVATAGSKSTVGPIAPANDFTFTRGITFTRKGTGDYTGEMRGDVTVTESVEIPTDFAVTNNSTLTIASIDSLENPVNLSIASGKTLTIESGSELINEGNILEGTAIDCEGTIKTLLTYDAQGGEIEPTNEDTYIIYQEQNDIKKYENLPEAEKEGYDFSGWYTKKDGQGTQVENGQDVLLNEHVLYAKWTPIPGPTPPDPGPDPEPTPTDTISITFTTAEGSWQGLHELTIEGEPEQLIVTPQYPEAPADKTCIGWFDEQGMQVISGQTTFSEVTGTVTARYAYTPGWHENATGWWYIYDLNNNYYINCWALIHGAWFYFTDQGYCLESCWGYINNVWYYFKAGGYMQTGWQYLNHTWYFLDRYTGEMKTGWQKDGVWYYLNPETGAMYNNCWAYINGYWYGFNEGGSMTQGWSYSYTYDGWFYLEPDTGHMLYAWQYIGGHWYYFYDNGLMAANTRIGTYRLGADGAMW